jgi:hypothetical protein
MTQAQIDAAVNDTLRNRSLLSLPQGGSGLTGIATTTPATGLDCYALVCLTDTVFATLTPTTGFSCTGITGVTQPAGTTIFGSYTAITLTSGSIHAYLR